MNTSRHAVRTHGSSTPSANRRYDSVLAATMPMWTPGADQVHTAGGPPAEPGQPLGTPDNTRR
ncbi:MAG: hypothetical protein ACXV3F_17275 [Frankiaceae bacterium]